MTNPKKEYEQDVDDLDDPLSFSEAVRRVIEGVEAGDYDLKHRHYPWTDEDPQIILDTGDGVSLTGEEYCLKVAVSSVIGIEDMTDEEVLNDLRKHMD